MHYASGRGLRHPLGIYNISAGRVLARLTRCANELNKITKLGNINQIPPSGDGELIDRLELILHGAVEHIDDVFTITEALFPNKSLHDKHLAVRTLKNSIKPLRDDLAAYVNAIKHHHNRIRLLQIEFRTVEENVVLTGFYLESVSDGKVGPNPLFHPEGKVVISVSAFLWQVIFFLHRVSNSLHSAVEALRIGMNKIYDISNNDLENCAAKLITTSAYSFDGEHPFLSNNLVVALDDDAEGLVDGQVLGSLLRPWNRLDLSKCSIGSWTLGSEGDGVSKVFEMKLPSNLKLVHWTPLEKTT
jgi:hypothetical protein